MIVILLTGILLTVARIPSWQQLYTTRFGILLSVKIFLFLIMFSSAVIVTVFIGPRLRKQRSGVKPRETRDYTLNDLGQFDGKDGRPAYIAFKGTVYEVTGSRLWKNGLHLMKHAAGNDLTELLKTAPHGEDRILAMPQAGRLVASEDKKPLPPFHERLFYFIAYMNLVLVFVITFVVALWRWW